MFVIAMSILYVTFLVLYKDANLFNTFVKILPQTQFWILCLGIVNFIITVTGWLVSTIVKSKKWASIFSMATLTRPLIIYSYYSSVGLLIKIYSTAHNFSEIRRDLLILAGLTMIVGWASQKEYSKIIYKELYKR